MLLKQTRQPSVELAGVTDREIPLGINTTVGSMAAVVALLACAVMPGRDGAAQLLLLGAVLAWFAATTGDAVAVLVVLVVTAALFQGFLVGREGELAWHGWPDLWRLAALAAGAAAGLATGRFRAWRADRRRFAPLEAWANLASAR